MGQWSRCGVLHCEGQVCLGLECASVQGSRPAVRGTGFTSPWDTEVCGEVPEESIPCTERCVCVSTSLRCCMSTMSP